VLYFRLRKHNHNPNKNSQQAHFQKLKQQFIYFSYSAIRKMIIL
jgi:hypothetical protein